MKAYTIVDSKTPLHVNVKPCDTRHAICSDHQKCVIAKALMRRMQAKWVDVGAHVVLIGRTNTKAERYILSHKAKEQVKYFDSNNGLFAPCKVTLNAPKDLGKQLGQRTGKKARSGKTLRKTPAKPTR